VKQYTVCLGIETSKDGGAGCPVCAAVSFGKWLSVGWRNVVTLWSKRNYSCTSWCGRWWHCMPPIHHEPLTSQHSVIPADLNPQQPTVRSHILLQKTG